MGQNDPPVRREHAQDLRRLLVLQGVTAALQSLADSGQIETVLAPYDPAHLSDAFLVFAATSQREVNARIVADSESRGLLVNVAHYARRRAEPLDNKVVTKFSSAALGNLWEEPRRMSR